MGTYHCYQWSNRAFLFLTESPWIEGIRFFKTSTTQRRIKWSNLFFPGDCAVCHTSKKNTHPPELCVPCVLIYFLIPVFVFAISFFHAFYQIWRRRYTTGSLFLCFADPRFSGCPDRTSCAINNGFWIKQSD